MTESELKSLDAALTSLAVDPSRRTNVERLLGTLMRKMACVAIAEDEIASAAKNAIAARGGAGAAEVVSHAMRWVEARLHALRLSSGESSTDTGASTVAGSSTDTGTSEGGRKQPEAYPKLTSTSGTPPQIPSGHPRAVDILASK